MILAILIVFILMRNLQRFYYNKPNASGNYLLLIAHPDDESMFFAPTLLNLRGRIRIVCLSDGGYDGLGDRRKEEMTSLCSKYGFELFLGAFGDNANWDPNEIADILMVTYLTDPFKTLITFDSKGVSGHRNHISCYHAAKLFSKSISCKMMYLKSGGFISKYLVSPIYIEKSYFTSFGQYFSPVLMMYEHTSQLRWFRYIYMVFSNYMSYNSYLE